jgi:hypothetical protein
MKNIYLLREIRWGMIFWRESKAVCSRQFAVGKKGRKD